MPLFIKPDAFIASVCIVKNMNNEQKEYHKLKSLDSYSFKMPSANKITNINASGANEKSTCFMAFQNRSHKSHSKKGIQPRARGIILLTNAT